MTAVLWHRRADDARGRLAAQGQQFRKLATVPVTLGILGPALCTFVGQRMPPRDDLWNGRYGAVTQATTANHEIAQLVEQAIADVVFRGGRHSVSPSCTAFLTLGGHRSQQTRHNRRESVNQSWFWV